MLYLIAIQSFLSGIVFLFRRPRHLSNLMLALFFFLLTLNFVGFIIPGGIKQYIIIGYLPFVFLLGPTIYFYVYSLISEDFHLKYKHLIHLIPFVLVSILRMFIWEEEILIKESLELKNNILLSIIIYGRLIHIFTYVVVVFIKLIKHKKKLEHHFASKSVKLTLSWVVFILVVLLLSYSIETFAPSIKTIYRSTDELFFWFAHFNMGMLGFLILVFGLQQPILFPKEQKSSTSITKVNKVEKYTNSTLTHELMVEISEMISVYLSENKPFLNPEYNLDIMSNDINISKPRISQTINEINKKNFYQLINEYRVEEFKHLLTDTNKQHITLLGLAYEAGFNSKASFNRVFKESTGYSPSAYKKQLQ